jgi:transcriptional regulator with XRE-family HTH domain
MNILPLPLPVARALQKLARDISLARRRRRLSQAALAQRSGVSERSVRRLESGDPGCSLEHLARILQVLGEIERLERLFDTGADTLGLLLMDEALPRKIRPRKSSGAT